MNERNYQAAASAYDRQLPSADDEPEADSDLCEWCEDKPAKCGHISRYCSLDHEILAWEANHPTIPFDVRRNRRTKDMGKRPRMNDYEFDNQGVHP